VFGFGLIFVVLMILYYMLKSCWNVMILVLGKVISIVFSIFCVLMLMCSVVWMWLVMWCCFVLRIVRLRMNSSFFVWWLRLCWER